MSGYTNATSGTNQESPGVPAVRKALSGAWAWCVRLVYEHTTLVLAIIFFVTMAGALWHLSRISIELVQSAALQGTSLYADALEEVRKLAVAPIDGVLGLWFFHDSQAHPPSCRLLAQSGRGPYSLIIWL